MKKILASFINNAVFANVAFIVIIISGLIASFNIVCEIFPEFSLDMITISISYPGADPEEVEEGVSRRVEEAIENIAGIKQYNTFSFEGICKGNLEIKKGYDTNDVIDSVKAKIGAISSFPKGVEKAIVRELTLKEPVMLLSISGDVSEESIKIMSRQIKDDITKLPQISSVKIFGNKKYQISVEVPENKLKKYNISLFDVTNSIIKNNFNLFCGNISNECEEIRIRTIGKKDRSKAISNITIIATPTGELVPLNYLANVKDNFIKDSTEVNINGNLGAILIIYKTKEENSLLISDSINKYVSEKKLVLSNEINFDILYDNTDMLRSRISLLIKNGFLGLFIVFISLWFFLNVRLSFWASMAIFISISGALVIIFLLDETINMISLFGLIMVLGIVVDDTIVVGESIYYNKQIGNSAFGAAIDGVREVGLPVLTAIITSIVAFMPLFYIDGIMGKFISILPTVVIACLFVSLVESIFLLPAHLSHLPDNLSKPAYSNFFTFKILEIKKSISKMVEFLICKIYTPVLAKVIIYRYFISFFFIALLFIVIGLFMGAILKFELFPSIDGFVVTSTIEFPEGTPLSVTKNAVKQVDEALVSLANKKLVNLDGNLVKSRLSVVGETLGDMPKKGSNLGSVQAILLESEKRNIHSEDFMILWEKEVGNISGLRSLKFEGLSAGPPGAPIEIWIQGYDINVLLKVKEDLISELKKFKGVYQIYSDFSVAKNEINLKLKPESVFLGLSLEDVAKQVNLAYYDNDILKIQRYKDEIKIKICYSLENRDSVIDLKKMMICIRNGIYVPLSSVAYISYSPGYSLITRTDGMRRLSVNAKVDVNKGNTNEIFSKLRDNFFSNVSRKNPEVTISFQGEQKKMKDSIGSLIIGFPVAILVIFIIIATTFRSYLQPIVIMAVIPFGVIGAAVGHLVLGYNISIMSVFGMVTLTGVVVNDAIVLIERINVNLALNMPFFESILRAGSRRFMPIFLTTISTVGGLAPIILETDLQAKFLIPMAISVAAGVAFTSFLTLIMIPSYIVILNDIRMLITKIKHNKWKKRELLEPAYNRNGIDV